MAMAITASTTARACHTQTGSSPQVNGTVAFRPACIRPARSTLPSAAVLSWHRVASTRDASGLAALLADNVVFRSPAVHQPQKGKVLTTAYLTAAIAVLGPSLTYVREWYGADCAVLEFTARLDDLDVHGIDMITWNDRDQLIEFTVMVRPIRALERLVVHMREQLTRTAP
jgi:hypothetical protein